jgi:hypothetical protein
MTLGTWAFVVLLASACLGAAMLVASLGLTLTKRWRRLGVLILYGGMFGALLGVLVLLVLGALSSAPSSASLEVWLTFGTAGFGWGGFLSGGVFVAIHILRHSTR